jgi:hypothetical protein
MHGNLKPPTPYEGSFTGVAGQAYDLELYWYEQTGGAVLKLEYKLNPSDAWTTVPASAFIEETHSQLHPLMMYMQLK